MPLWHSFLGCIISGPTQKILLAPLKTDSKMVCHDNVAPIATEEMGSLSSYYSPGWSPRNPGRSPIKKLHITKSSSNLILVGVYFMKKIKFQNFCAPSVTHFWLCYFCVSFKVNYYIRAVWPDLAIYWTLGKFLKPMATINLPKSHHILRQFLWRC